MDVSFKTAKAMIAATQRIERLAVGLIELSTEAVGGMSDAEFHVERLRRLNDAQRELEAYFAELDRFRRALRRAKAESAIFGAGAGAS